MYYFQSFYCNWLNRQTVYEIYHFFYWKLCQKASRAQGIMRAELGNYTSEKLANQSVVWHSVTDSKDMPSQEVIQTDKLFNM